MVDEEDTPSPIEAGSLLLAALTPIGSGVEGGRQAIRVEAGGDSPSETGSETTDLTGDDVFDDAVVRKDGRRTAADETEALDEGLRSPKSDGEGSVSRLETLEGERFNPLLVVIPDDERSPPAATASLVAVAPWTDGRREDDMLGARDDDADDTIEVEAVVPVGPFVVEDDVLRERRGVARADEEADEIGREGVADPTTPEGRLWDGVGKRGVVDPSCWAREAREEAVRFKGRGVAGGPINPAPPADADES